MVPPSGVVVSSVSVPVIMPVTSFSKATPRPTGTNEGPTEEGADS